MNEVHKGESDTSDLAGSGYDTEAEGSHGAVSQDNQIDADGEGSTRNVLGGRPANGDKAITDSAEYHVALPDDSCEEVRLALSWTGPLPHPDDFNKYPEFVQHRLMSLYERETDCRIKRQDKVLESAVAREKEQSCREDLLTDAEIEDAKFAQRGTLAINISLIITVMLLGVTGHDAPSVAALGALAVFNVATLFVPLRSRDAKQISGENNGLSDDSEKPLSGNDGKKA